MGHCRMADLGLPPRRVPQFALMGIAAFGASILFSARRACQILSDIGWEGSGFTAAGQDSATRPSSASVSLPPFSNLRRQWSE